MRNSVAAGFFTFSVIIGATLFAPSSASAGNIWLTGHDADLHCAFGAQCNHYGIALDFVRQDAPNKALPILFLTSPGGDMVNAAGQALAKAKNTVEGAGNPFAFTVVDPTDAAFAALALTTTAFSAIAIASDSTCGGCDNNAADIVAINARTADITAFFNAGGGLAYFAGSERRDDYYDSVPIGATAAAVSPPFTLTADGVAIGLLDPQDTDCCPTHNAFVIPAATSPLKVAELDSTGLAETLFAGNVSIGPPGGGGGGGFIPGEPGTPGVIPEPATIGLFLTGLGGLFLYRRHMAKGTV